MEVHHPHAHHGPKKWSEHFLEFFMLFLAVTLGFFAENQREHYVEQHREVQYMQSLVEDLKNDTIEFNRATRQNNRLVNNLDTALSIFYKNEWNDSSLKKLYLVNLSYLGTLNVYLSERTESQLKNAGGLRLIRNQKITDEIAEYWHLSEYGKIFSKTYDELKVMAREKSYSIFDQKFYSNITSGAVGTSVDKNARLMTYDKFVLTEFANRLSHIKNATKNVQKVIIEKQRALAIKLINDVNEAYHLEEHSKAE